MFPIANPQVRVVGTVRLPSGEVNLVAPQLALDREHANLISFQAEQSGLDPVVDVVMTGGDLRVAIQVCMRLHTYDSPLLFFIPAVCSSVVCLHSGFPFSCPCRARPVNGKIT